MYSCLSLLFYYLLIIKTTSEGLKSRKAKNKNKKKININEYPTASDLLKLSELLKTMNTEYYNFKKETEKLQSEDETTNICLDEKNKCFSKIKEIYTEAYNILKKIDVHSETFINLPRPKQNLEIISFIIGCFIFELMTLKITLCFDDSSFLVDFIKTNNHPLLNSIIKNKSASSTSSIEAENKTQKIIEGKQKWLSNNNNCFKGLFKLLTDTYKDNAENISKKKVDFIFYDSQKQIKIKYFDPETLSELNEEEQESISDIRDLIKRIEGMNDETTRIKFGVLKELAYNFLERLDLKKRVEELNRQSKSGTTFIEKRLRQETNKICSQIMRNSFLYMLSLTDNLTEDEKNDILSQIEIIQKKNTELWKNFIKFISTMSIENKDKNIFIFQVQKGNIYFDTIRRIFIYVISRTYEPHEEFI